MDLIAALVDVGHTEVFAIDVPIVALDRLGFDREELEKANIIATTDETFRLQRYQPQFVRVEGFAETPREPVGSRKRGRKLIGGGGNWSV
jgi:hypothetical protein